VHTVLRSATREVVIGHDQPFCVIGERLNPTGRPKFAEQLRAGDLSRVEIDVAEQVAGGAMVLDVNMGVPLADEAELLASAIRLVSSLTDLPLCIDSSVVEALEAGLAAYEGKALVNSVTAEDERLDAILPLVSRHGAAVSRHELDQQRAIVRHPAEWITDRRVDRDAFQVVDLAGRCVADPGLDSRRSRVQEGEVFSVVAPFESADLRAGWYIDLDLRTVGDALEH